VRKIGGPTIRSIGHVARLQRLSDNDAEYVDPLDMLAELREDNRMLLASMREVHDLCGEENDVATASLLENGSMRQNGASGFSLRSRGVARLNSRWGVTSISTLAVCAAGIAVVLLSSAAFRPRR